MRVLKALGAYLKLGVQFPDHPHLRNVRVQRRTAMVSEFMLGPERPVAEIVISYEYKVPYPYEGQAPWSTSTLVIHEWDGKPKLLANYDHMGLEFDPPSGSSGSIPIWLVSLPLSALFPIWLTWHLGHVAVERSVEMTRYSRAAYNALAPHLDEYTRLLLEEALHRHWKEYRARTA
jgi:hypothetical protein